MPKIIDEPSVFSAVINVLISRGYEGATTKEMAAAAGIHEATLFRKFGSKVNLIERAIAYQLGSAPLSKVIYTGDLTADLNAILQSYLDTSEAYGEIIPTIILEMPRHPELKNTLNAAWANIQGVMKIIDRYQSEGLLIKEPLHESISVLLGPIMISQMFQRANLDLPTLVIDPREFVDAFLHGRKT